MVYKIIFVVGVAIFLITAYIGLPYQSFIGTHPIDFSLSSFWIGILSGGIFFFIGISLYKDGSVKVGNLIKVDKNLWMLITIFILFSSVFYPSWLATVNGMFDSKTASCYKVLVINKEKLIDKLNFGRGHFVPMTYFKTTVQSWKPNRHQETFYISQSNFDRIIPNVSFVKVCTKPGVLGWEWVQSCKLAEESSKGLESN